MENSAAPVTFPPRHTFWFGGASCNCIPRCALLKHGFCRDLQWPSRRRCTRQPKGQSFACCGGCVTNQCRRSSCRRRLTSSSRAGRRARLPHKPPGQCFLSCYRPFLSRALWLPPCFPLCSRHTIKEGYNLPCRKERKKLINTNEKKIAAIVAEQV